MSAPIFGFDQFLFSDDEEKDTEPTTEPTEPVEDDEKILKPDPDPDETLKHVRDLTDMNEQLKGLLPENKRQSERITELEAALERASETIRQLSLERDASTRRRQLYQTNLLSSLLGQHKLYQDKQRSYQHYRNLVDDCERRGFLLRKDHGGSRYAKRLVKPGKIGEFNKFIRANRHIYYDVKVNRYNGDGDIEVVKLSV